MKLILLCFIHFSVDCVSETIFSMEFDSPLNRAHSNVRKSENLQKTGKFQEAIELQDKIVELLAEALEGARDNKIRESLILQIENHKQQKQVMVKMSNVSASGSGDGLQVRI